MFATFLTEFDGELQVLRVSPHCCVLKLDRSKVNWFQVDNLSNLSLFIEDATSNVSIISDPMEEESGHLANTILWFDHSCCFNCPSFAKSTSKPHPTPNIYDCDWKDQLYL